MSSQMPEEPFLEPGGGSPLETVIIPRTRDLGGFEVRRALPSARRRMVGPFVFLDQMGPAVFRSGHGLDVRPHPHIGLATVTYLFDGEILHRDSLGTVQPIRPGAVNWMTAGSGIVHSERTPPEARASGGRLFGVQIWLALPERDEETAPAFVHTPADALPVITAHGLRLRVVIGSLHGARSPVRTFSETVYADVELDAGARFEIPADHEERAIFVVEGALDVSGDVFPAGPAPRLCAPGATSSCTHAGLRACSCSAASRWTGRATSRGTSSRARESGSSWRGRTGPPGGFLWCPARPSVSRSPTSRASRGTRRRHSRATFRATSRASCRPDSSQPSS